MASKKVTKRLLPVPLLLLFGSPLTSHVIKTAIWAPVATAGDLSSRIAHHVGIGAAIIQVLSLLLCLAIMLVGASRFARSRQKFAVVISRLIIAALIVGMGWSVPKHLRDPCEAPLERAANEGRPIVKAIHAYRDLQGSFPNDLGDLVPNYLPALPGTRILQSPSFRYSCVDASCSFAWIEVVMNYGIHISSVGYSFGSERDGIGGSTWRTEAGWLAHCE